MPSGFVPHRLPPLHHLDAPRADAARLPDFQCWWWSSLRFFAAECRSQVKRVWGIPRVVRDLRCRYACTPPASCPGTATAPPELCLLFVFVNVLIVCGRRQHQSDHACRVWVQMRAGVHGCEYFKTPTRDKYKLKERLQNITFLNRKLIVLTIFSSKTNFSATPYQGNF